MKRIWSFIPFVALGLITQSGCGRDGTDTVDPTSRPAGQDAPPRQEVEAEAREQSGVSDREVATALAKGLLSSYTGNLDFYEHAWSLLDEVDPHRQFGLPILVEGLDSEDGRRAARALAYQGLEPEHCIAVLEPMATESDPFGRRDCYRFLSRLTGLEEKVVPIIATGLDETKTTSDDLARREAIAALGRLGKPAHVAAPRLLALATGNNEEDDPFEFAEDAWDALAEMQAFGDESILAAKAVVERGLEPDGNGRNTYVAAHAGAYLGRAGAMEALPLLLRSLRTPSNRSHGSPDGRDYFASAVVRLDPDGTYLDEIIPSELYESPKPLLTAYQIQHLGPSALPAVDKIVTFVTQRPIVGRLEFELIVGIGKMGDSGAGPLCSIYAHFDKTSMDREVFQLDDGIRAVAEGLAKMTLEAEVRLVARKVALDERVELTKRLNLIESLLRQGADSELEAIVVDAISRGEIRADWEHDLGAPVVRAVVARLDDLDQRQLGATLNRFAEQGPRARVATERIVEYLDDPDESVRLAAARALESIHGESAEVVAAVLTRCAEEPDERVKATLLLILGNFPSEAERLVPILRTETESNDGDIRRAACRALGGLGPPAIPVLESLLSKSSSPSDKAAVLKGIGRLGAHSSKMLPQLLEVFAKDEHSEVKTIALESIRVALVPSARP